MQHAFASDQAESTRKRGDWQVIRTLLPFLWPARGIANAVRQGRRGVVSGLQATIARELGTRADAV